MNYPIVIHKDPKSDFGVTVPDLPGCFSGGVTLDDAIANSKEAIELHLEGIIEEGQPVPEPTSIEVHQKNPDLADGIFAVVSVDLSKLAQNPTRINISLPERILATVDRFAEAEGETRSGLLAKAASAYIATHRGAGRLEGFSVSGGGESGMPGVFHKIDVPSGSGKGKFVKYTGKLSRREAKKAAAKRGARKE